MTQPVLLNNVEHADLRVRLGHAAAFGDAVNQMLIFPTEFEDIQRHYPIVFQRTEDDRYRAVALLGLDRDENLFLDGDRWDASYVPAIQQRGPFSIGLQRSGDPAEAQVEPMIHVDLDHPRISRSDGEALFRTHGGNSDYLDHVARILGVIHDGVQITGAMFAAWEEYRLIEPVVLRVDLDEETRYDIPDCLAIATDRLAALDGAALAALNRAGFLRLAFLAAASLGNVSRLIDRKLRRRAAAAT